MIKEIFSTIIAMIVVFLLGFIVAQAFKVDHTNFWSMISAIGTVLIPISLSTWAWYSEKQKEFQQKQKDDRDFIYKAIQQYIYPLTVNFIPRSQMCKYRNILNDIWDALAKVNTRMSYTVYDFVNKEYGLLLDIIAQIDESLLKNNQPCLNEAHVFYIEMLNFLDVLEVTFLDRKTYEENKYLMFILLQKKKGNIEKITSKILQDNKYVIPDTIKNNLLNRYSQELKNEQTN